jgi:hypothetical protein
MAARIASTSGVGDGVGTGVALGDGERVTTGAIVGLNVGEGNKRQLTSMPASIAIPRIHLLPIAVHLDRNVDTSVMLKCGSSVAEVRQVRGK